MPSIFDDLIEKAKNRFLTHSPLCSQDEGEWTQGEAYDVFSACWDTARELSPDKLASVLILLQARRLPEQIPEDISGETVIGALQSIVQRFLIIELKQDEMINAEDERRDELARTN